MPLFLTSYAEGVGYYGAYIEADNFAHAREVAGRRGLNERIEGKTDGAMIPNQLTQLIAAEKWVEAAHEATFLGYIGLTSGTLTPRDLLADHGLIHELLHLARPFTHHPDEDPEIVAEDKAERAETIAHVGRLAAQFEYRVPGWEPSGGKPGVLSGKDD